MKYYGSIFMKYYGSTGETRFYKYALLNRHIAFMVKYFIFISQTHHNLYSTKNVSLFGLLFRIKHNHILIDRTVCFRKNIIEDTKNI